MYKFYFYSPTNRLYMTHRKGPLPFTVVNDRIFTSSCFEILSLKEEAIKVTELAAMIIKFNDYMRLAEFVRMNP